MRERFPWSRRWSRRGADPADFLGRDGQPLAAWSDTPCLILLGEGGLGKTYELEAEAERLADAGWEVYRCDLGSTTDRAEIRDRVLSVPPAGEQAAVLIDAFDEVFDDVNDIAELIASHLESLDRASVCVRIASRPVVWSSRLEERRESLWPDGSTSPSASDRADHDRAGGRRVGRRRTRPASAGAQRRRRLLTPSLRRGSES